jgi:soluble lytic murein transglycosylase-like protein
MSNARIAILPGIIIGSLFIVLVSSLLIQPEKALAAAAAGQNDSERLFDSCSLSASYPDSILQWCEWIEEYAARNGLEPNLIAAMMLQESGGNPQAYSKSGAVGLLQVMPRDGLAAGFMCPNGPCFASRPSMDELYDPEYNISYGAGMMGGLVNKYGNLRDALKAYGPMNVGYYYADLVLGIFQQYR